MNRSAQADQTLRAILSDVLALSAARTAAITPATRLLGGMPEFDSLAVANVAAEIEERFGIRIADDDLSAEDFGTYGALLDFVRSRSPA